MSDSSDKKCKRLSFAIYEKNNKDGLPGRRGVFIMVDVNASKFDAWNSYVLDEPAVVGWFFCRLYSKEWCFASFLATDGVNKGKYFII